MNSVVCPQLSIVQLLCSPNMKTFEVESVSNTYEYLWSACEKSLQDAGNTSGSPWYYYFTAMTMAYFCYEAFLNHLLLHIAPDIWNEEREYFSKSPYKGTEGKLRKVCDIARLPFPDKGSRQYQQIKLLQELRDFVAHGKTEKHNSVIQATSGCDTLIVQSTLEKLVTKDNACHAIPALKEFIITLNGQVQERTFCDHLALQPLQGISYHVTSSEIPS